MISSPPKKNGHFLIRERDLKNGTVNNISMEVICNDCRSKPLELQVLCTHIRPKDNPTKSSSVRKQESSIVGANYLTVLRETMGVVTVGSTGFYPEDDLNFLFSTASIVSHTSQPKCYFSMWDPNAGNRNHTAVVFGYIMDDKYVICWVDSKQTISYKEFIDFFIDNLTEFHNKIRKNSAIPIITIVESQASWNGNVVDDKIFEAFRRGNDALAGVYLLSDKSKQGFGVMRKGVVINRPRMNEMIYRLSSLMMMKGLRFLDKWGTASKYGREYIYDEFSAQMKRFRHFEEGENSKYGPTGTLKNNSGKEGTLNDDICSALHMFILWAYKFLNERDYLPQKRMFGL